MCFRLVRRHFSFARMMVLKRGILLVIAGMYVQENQDLID